MDDFVTFPNPVSETSDAPLPQVYEAARAALAELDSVDECKTWADKAAALASYAKQANDNSLRVMAVRIQARAERRIGELLRQIEPKPGARTDLRPAPVRGPEVGHGHVFAQPITRTQAASQAGLSERQRKTALRIASVPTAVFEAQVESQRPPSITHLANQGTVTRHGQVTYQSPGQQHAPPPSDANAAIAVLVQICESNDPEQLARSAGGHESLALRRDVGTVVQWLRRFSTHLPEV